MLMDCGHRQSQGNCGATKWGVAYNATRCAPSATPTSISAKLLKYVERPNPIVVRSPSQIPKPKGRGIWVHPVGKNRLHVHAGEKHLRNRAPEVAE